MSMVTGKNSCDKSSAVDVPAGLASNGVNVELGRAERFRWNQAAAPFD